LPSIPSLLRYAAELEAERDHVLGLPDDAEDERAPAEALRQRCTADELDQRPFQALEASAQFDRILYDGNEFGVTAEEEDFLGLPGLLEPDQVAMLLRDRKVARLPSRAAADPPTAGRSSEPTARETLAALRKELNGLVAAWHHRTGQAHGAIHADLRRSCGGPPLPQATADQIRARIEMMRKMARSRQ